MSKFTNFVRGVLTEAIDADPDTAVKIAFEAPFQPPADPDGERVRLILMDDARRPRQFEVISFTGLSSSVALPSPGVDAESRGLVGVERGLDGTTAQSWSAGAVVGQDLPAAIMQILAAEPDNGEVLMLGAGRLLTYDQISYAHLFGKPTERKALRLVENADPDTPPSGDVHIFLAPGKHLKAIFDDGTTDYITPEPPPPPTIGESDSVYTENDNETTISLPAGVADGDYVLVGIALVNGSGSVGITPPTGFSELERQEDAFSHPTVAVFGGVADTGSPDLTFGFDQALDHFAALASIEGVNSSTPTGSTATETSSTSSISDSVSLETSSIAVGFGGIGGEVGGTGSGSTTNILTPRELEVSIYAGWSDTGTIDVSWQGALNNALVVVEIKAETP